MLEQDTEPIQMVERFGIGIVGQLLQALAHAVEAKFAQLIDGGVLQQGLGSPFNDSSEPRMLTCRIGVLCEIRNSRPIARMPSPAPKCSPINRCICRIASLFVGIGHSVQFPKRVIMPVRRWPSRPLPLDDPPQNGGRHPQNRGRHHLRTVDGFVRMLDGIAS